MRISELRKMSDEELEAYIKRISNNAMCAKCGDFTEPNDKRNIYVNIYGKHGVMQRKLCSLCQDCYNKLLDFIGISDIDWEE